MNEDYRPTAGPAAEPQREMRHIAIQNQLDRLEGAINELARLVVRINTGDGSERPQLQGEETKPTRSLADLLTEAPGILAQYTGHLCKIKDELEEALF